MVNNKLEEISEIILNSMTNEVMDKMIKSISVSYNATSIIDVYDYFDKNCGCGDFKQIFINNLSEENQILYNELYENSDFDDYDWFMWKLGNKVSERIKEKVDKVFKVESL